MKTVHTIPFDAEYKKSKYFLHTLTFYVLEKVNGTSYAFTGWRKSKDMGKPGTTPFSEGHSTLGSTGLPCPFSVQRPATVTGSGISFKF